MLNYKRYGKGKPLVLIHGFLGGIDYWIPVITELKNKLEIIAVDVPGFAGSAHIPAPDSMEGLAASIIELMDSIKVDSFSMLGFSMGGMIAQQAAFDHPHRVVKMILYGSAAVGDLPNRFEPWEASIERMKAQGVEATADKTVKTWFVEEEHHPYYPFCREACRGASEQACIQIMRAIQRWTAIGRLHELKMPTLAIVGDMDRSTKPSESIELWEGLTNASLCILPGCAHGAHMEKPALFNQVILDFMLENK